MILRIGVGVTQEWVEEAVPLLERAGLQQVRRRVPAQAEGEYIECDFDGGAEPLEARFLFEQLAQVRAIVARSMVPHITVQFVADTAHA